MSLTVDDLLPGAALPGSATTRQPRRRHEHVALFVALLILTALVGGLAGGVYYMQHRLTAGLEYFDNPFADLGERPAAAAAAAPADETEDAATPSRSPVTILAVGSDSRISAGDPMQWTYGAQRTDAIMVVQISGDRRHVSVMSIPRDSWVPIPGWGTHKVNAAFSFGGPPLMVETVENLLDVRIDHVVIADFTSFVALTDALGGVDLFLPDGMSSGGVELPPGTHRLDGQQALAYSRDRFNVPGGDFGRMERQQNWLRAMFREVSAEKRVADPGGTLKFLEVVAANVAVDETLTMTKMRELAWSMAQTDLEDGIFFTAPVTGVGRSPDGAQSIVMLDQARLAEVSAAFAEDRVAELLAEQPGIASPLGDVVR